MLGLGSQEALLPGQRLFVPSHLSSSSEKNSRLLPTEKHGAITAGLGLRWELEPPISLASTTAPWGAQEGLASTHGAAGTEGTGILCPPRGQGWLGGIRSGGTRAALGPPPHAGAATHPRARRSAALGRARVATVTARSQPAPAINTLLRVSPIQWRLHRGQDSVAPGPGQCGTAATPAGPRP